MLLIKTYAGNGSWDLREAESGLRHLGSHNLEIAKDRDHDFWADDRYPTHGVTQLHVFVLTADEGGKHDANGALCRWVVYTDPNDHRCQMVIANTPIYICNERGDTIESLRC